ncbi:hypothetical protein EGH21_03270 [Halomicroarcula sp. F13]|uniref:Uncharacterized protein n=1 Tax=Haloarcula rubra TaxID=2487747 RepID=A0AAW4PNS3_9EURY|nr:hypothetical protein [Halomicroarcula rubra]MBX0322047.1 hypothetical protein [Halomicroarcula rubra]
MSRRGQLVLVAAALVAVALAPVVLAYLQLGYHDDVRATAEYDDPTTDTLRVLDRAVATASRDVPGDYAWSRRTAAVTHVRDELRPTVARLETARVERGTVTGIAYNASVATTWADASCPSGPARQFGDCIADRGVVVQDRTDRTHVLAVAVDVTTTTERGTTAVTVVVDATGH